jgi:hypothetical protein
MESGQSRFVGFVRVAKPHRENVNRPRVWLVRRSGFRLETLVGRAKFRATRAPAPRKKGPHAQMCGKHEEKKGGGRDLTHPSESARRVPLHELGLLFVLLVVARPSIAAVAAPQRLRRDVQFLRILGSLCGCHDSGKCVLVYPANLPCTRALVCGFLATGPSCYARLGRASCRRMCRVPVCTHASRAWLSNPPKRGLDARRTSSAEGVPGEGGARFVGLPTRGFREQSRFTTTTLLLQSGDSTRDTQCAGVEVEKARKRTPLGVTHLR